MEITLPDVSDIPILLIDGASFHLQSVTAYSLMNLISPVTHRYQGTLHVHSVLRHVHSVLRHVPKLKIMQLVLPFAVNFSLYILWYISNSGMIQIDLRTPCPLNVLFYKFYAQWNFM